MRVEFGGNLYLEGGQGTPLTGEARAVLSECCPFDIWLAGREWMRLYTAEVVKSTRVGCSSSDWTSTVGAKPARETSRRTSRTSPKSQASDYLLNLESRLPGTTDTTRSERHIPCLSTAKELDQQTTPMLQSSHQRITALPSTACVSNLMCFTYHPYRSMSALPQAKASRKRHCFLLFSR